jgi:glyoxylase-like metal-dependent hydrolase (beta-lactamase superfamily II)
MEPYAYSAEELFDAIFNDTEDFLLLDVRNNEEFSKFNVEGPYLKQTLNLPYVEFIEQEEENVAKVPEGRKIRIVCAKEGSAKYVGDILVNAGFDDVGYLSGGIGLWADLLKPILIEENEKFSLYQFVRPGKASLSYGLVCEDELYLFDPARTAHVYIEFAKSKGLKIARTFETHLQADYISGSRQIAQQEDAQLIANENDFSIASFDYYKISDGEQIVCKDRQTTVKALHTPGHTPGSTSYLIDDTFLISGDAVFIKSIGRPDLGGQVEAWSHALFETIQQVLKQLDSRINVLPGHYMDWSEMSEHGLFMETLGRIIDRNRDIYDIDDVTTFTGFIKSNMRKQPDVYAEIRKVNAGLLEPSPDEQKIMDVGKNECAASAARQ